MPNAADPSRPSEAVQASSDSPQEVPTASKKRSETAMTNNKHTTPQVPMKDYYSVQDVAALLGTSQDRIREYANRPIDPMPFRLLPGLTRGMFINRQDLADWVWSNTVLACKIKGKGPRDEGR